VNAPRWRPLSRRELHDTDRGLDLVTPALYDGVPPHLERALRSWVLFVLGGADAALHAERVALRLHLSLADIRPGPGPDLRTGEAMARHSPPEQLLDVIDAALCFHPSHARLALIDLREPPPPSEPGSTRSTLHPRTQPTPSSRPHQAPGSDTQGSPASVSSASQVVELARMVHSGARQIASTSLDLACNRLESLLVDGDSLWTITADRRGLRRRISAATENALDDAERAAAEQGGPQHAAAADLAAARSHLYALHPDPSAAYRLAVRAVEHAAVPVVLPRSSRATLGLVIAHLNQTTDAWQLATGADASTVATMMGELWKGHHDRHGGQPDMTAPTPAAAEVALSLASTLVMWLVNGHLVRATGTP